MQKRVEAVIHILVDTEAKGTSSTKHVDVGFGSAGQARKLFEVSVVSDNLASTNSSIETDIRTSLAHELGHVVAIIVGTEANAKDPRTNPAGNRWTENPGKAVFDSEKEAWDIAREIAPIDEEQAKRDLDTYAPESYAPSPEAAQQMELAMIIEGLASLTGGTVH